VDFFHIDIKGKSAHVSTPQLGSDALYAASQAVIALQSIVTRRTSPMETVLIGIGKMSAGTIYNIVAENAFLEGTVRALNTPVRNTTRALIDETVQSSAALSGTTAKVLWKDFAPVLINDRTCCEEVFAVARKFLPADAVITDREPSLGGDNFADFLNTVPGCYAYIGTRNKNQPNTGAAHHNSHFDIDEDSLVIASSLYAEYAQSWLLSN
jgi:amidohydrolase